MDLVRRSRALLLVALGTTLAGCRPAAPPLFESLPPAATGVEFVNRLPEDSTFNILNYLYYYNGGGVAVGDVNNDGLPDLYFTSNLGANRLYLNRGNYRFEDVTARAGVADSVGWKTGVTMADVNGDGWLDIYVSAVSYLAMHGHNVLYINNRDGTFRSELRRLEDRRHHGGRERRRVARHLRLRRELPRDARPQRALHQQPGRDLHRPNPGIRARVRGLLHPGALLRLRRRRRPGHVPPQPLDPHRARHRLDRRPPGA